ncbi:MAG: ABC oligo/dipeptide transport, ATP-binding protein [Rhodospirillaceae bacterium]|nr:MAG: ABC oligo/dipeptide transport, ATP-binding protein [Rhodospirillaceae bacterium]
MIINRISISRFRGFQDVAFSLGNELTVIAGQNGTQKTTLLGLLSQPFSISDKTNPMHGELPLCGGSYRSGFAEKFKLSTKFDTPKAHEWTLSLTNVGVDEFTVESMKRSGSQDIRFWKKGDRSKGSGYIQRPVIYLSLSRLFPIGEDVKLDTSSQFTLSTEEFKFFNDWHNKVLCTNNLIMTNADYLASRQKNTIGVNTDFYDWKMNSAGQDNIGKILLAILSFKRLKEKHAKSYQGGLLVIDELDATLYPASQLKLLDALRTFASKFKIQIIFTTHSLGIIEKSCEYAHATGQSDKVKVIYLDRVDNNIRPTENLTYEDIKHRLNITMAGSPKSHKIMVFSEDDECTIFFKALLKRKASNLKFLDFSLGCSQLIDLANRKIPSFSFPQSIIALDGDVRAEKKAMAKIKKLKNVMMLPGKVSPEKLLAEFLHDLPDASPVWNKIWNGYRKDFVFKDISLAEINQDRKKAKEWFRSQQEYWGKGSVKLINEWSAVNAKEVEKFKADFDELYQHFETTLDLH